MTYGITVGLRPPLKTTTLSGKPVLIRYATEDNPSLTQSIDCDVDNYPYPAPYNTLPSDVAEIANGCVTPYKVNPTLDCSAYSNGDLPPAAPPTTTFANAPDCAQSKNGQVSSLRKGLVARLTLPNGSCAPNQWPKKPGQPLTQAEIDTWLEGLGDDPRLVTLVVTEFAAFSGSGTEIIPIRYFAGFYITGKDISSQSPRCPTPAPAQRTRIRSTARATQFIATTATCGATTSFRSTTRRAEAPVHNRATSQAHRGTVSSRWSNDAR